MAAFGRRGWISRGGAGWEPCNLLEQNDNQLKIVLKGKIEIVDSSNSKFYLRNPDDVEAVDDFLQLPFLDEPNILQSLVCELIAAVVVNTLTQVAHIEL